MEEEDEKGGGKSPARSRPQRREAGEQRVEAVAGTLRLSTGRDRRSLNSDVPSAPLAIRIPSSAAAAAKADGTRAPEKEQDQTEAALRLGKAMTFPLTPSARRAVRSRRRSTWRSGGAQAISDSAPNPTGTGLSTCHNTTGPLEGGPRIAEPANRGPSWGGTWPNRSPSSPSRPRAHSPGAAVLRGYGSLSVERRGFEPLCCRRGVLGGSARCMELSRVEGSAGGGQQRRGLRKNRCERD